MKEIYIIHLSQRSFQFSKHFWQAALALVAMSALSLQFLQIYVFSQASSALAMEPNPFNMLAGTYPLCCFRPKNLSQETMSEQVHYRDTKANFPSIIPEVFFVLLFASGA